MRYDDLYRKGKELLAAHEVPDYSLDARLLLEFVCNATRNDLLAHPEREVSSQQTEEYYVLLGKRVKRVPLQHITGIQNFMGLDFYVNSSTLIPRQDTETLVEEAMLCLHDGMEILDLCTGSGCILISLLHYSNDCHGVGTDINEIALLLASKNNEKHQTNATFICSDLFDKVEGRFDIIVSNPPYIRSSDIGNLMPEVQQYEPIAALDGGTDGLYFYRQIVSQSAEHLYNGAHLLMEIGYDEGEAVVKLMETAGYKEVAVIKDLAGRDRVVRGIFISV